MHLHFNVWKVRQPREQVKVTNIIVYVQTWQQQESVTYGELGDDTTGRIAGGGGGSPPAFQHKLIIISAIGLYIIKQWQSVVQVQLAVRWDSIFWTAIDERRSCDIVECSHVSSLLTTYHNIAVTAADKLRPTACVQVGSVQLVAAVKLIRDSTDTVDCAITHRDLDRVWLVYSLWC